MYVLDMWYCHSEKIKTLNCFSARLDTLPKTKEEDSMLAAATYSDTEQTFRPVFRTVRLLEGQQHLFCPAFE